MAGTGTEGKRYRPPKYTAAQDAFWSSPARFRALVGGIGSGKSLAGVYEVLSQPCSVGCVIAPSYPMMRDSTLRSFLTVARSEGCLRSFTKDPLDARLTSGTEVMFRTADDPDRLRGPNLGWFWLDEAAMMDPEVWLVMIGRLREQPARAWATSTPRGFNWLFENFSQSDDPNYWFISCSTRDNPFLPSGFVESLEAQYDEHWSAQEIGGQFIATSEYSVFDGQYLRNLLLTLPDPVKVWKDGMDGICGNYQMWEEPQKGIRYTIGCDVAEGLKKEKSDFSDACILRNDTWAQVGHYFGKPDPKSYAYDLNNLSEWYNRAELVVENNSVGLVVIAYLDDLGANLWYNDRDEAPDLGEEPDRDQRAGFRTTARSKGLVDGELKAAIVDAGQGRRSIGFHSKRTVEQCIHYVHLASGARGGEGAWHDDAVRSAGLAWYVAKDHGLRAPREPRRETNPYASVYRGRGR